MKKVIASLVILLSLAACSMPGITPKQRFEHTHTQEELKLAEPFVTEITLTSWKDMRRRTLGTVHGETVPNGDGTYKILIADYLSDEGIADVTEHEMGHVYRLAVLGVSGEDEANHAGTWKLSNPIHRQDAFTTDGASNRRVANPNFGR